MVDGKQAVGKAIDYVKSVYDASQVTDLMLEEEERSEDGKHWYVTLSFTPQGKASGGAPMERTYKVVKIVVETGELLSMKIRKY